MVRPRAIPVLLYSGTGLVKSVQFRDHKYVGDVLNAVRIFNEKEVDEILLLDIDATRQSKPPNLNLISEVASECFMPLAYGGGIRSLADMKGIFKLGVEKIVVNTVAADSPELITAAAEHFGSQSIVVSVDVRKRLFGGYEVVTNSGERRTGLDPVRYCQKMASLGSGELFLNSVDCDGTMTGYDLELIKRVAAAVNVPVIACGGAGKLSDFRLALQAGAASVAAGSMFVFHGRHRAVLISYPSAQEFKDLLCQ